MNQGKAQRKDRRKCWSVWLDVGGGASAPWEGSGGHEIKSRMECEVWPVCAMEDQAKRIRKCLSREVAF